MARPKIVRYPFTAKYAAEIPIVLSADGAIPIDEDAIFSIAKGSAAALSIAAPGEKNIGRRLKFMVGSNFAHVLTFTGATLEDGTSGLKATWIFDAIVGNSLTVVARTATRWSVESFNQGSNHIYEEPEVFTNAQLQAIGGTPLTLVAGVPGAIIIPRIIIIDANLVALPTNAPTFFAMSDLLLGVIEWASLTPDWNVGSTGRRVAMMVTPAFSGAPGSDLIGRPLVLSATGDLTGGDAANRYAFSSRYELYQPVVF
jgi:hypothetical protein